MNYETTLADVEGMLRFISSDDREVWVNVGNALKTEFGDVAHDMWDQWSQLSDRYEKHAADSTWRTFQLGNVSVGYIVNQAKLGGWKPEKKELNAAEKKAFKAEAEARRKARKAKVEADEAHHQTMQAHVAMACRELFKKAHVSSKGESEYLTRKRVPGYGIGYPKHTLLISIDDKACTALLFAGTQVKKYFEALPKPRPDHLSFLLIKPGDIVIPLRDHTGEIQSLQVIKTGGKKLFPKYGRKSGCYHTLKNDQGNNPQTVAVVEGFATGASVRLATGWCVVVALDSGNLSKVAQTMRLVYTDARVVIAGDDDPDNPKNPGRTKAQEIADQLGTVALFPKLETVSEVANG